MRNLWLVIFLCIMSLSLYADRLILNFANGNVGRIDVSILDQITFTEPGNDFLKITLRDNTEYTAALSEIDYLDFSEEPATLRVHLLSGATNEIIFGSILHLSFYDPSPVDDLSVGSADHLIVKGNHPNPFNPETDILLSLAEQTHVHAEIFDVRGSLVRNLTDSILPAGEQRIHWNGQNDRNETVPSGVYLYRITTGATSTTGKMLLLK